MGRPIGTSQPFTEEHKQHLAEARRKSPRMRQHLLNVAAKGLAGSRATAALNRLGETREHAPRLWDAYRDLYLEEINGKQIPA